MKAFWAVLAALILAGGAYMLYSARAAATQDRQLVESAATKSIAASPSPASPTADDLAVLKKQGQELAATTAPKPVDAPAPVPPPAADPPKPAAPNIESNAAPAPTPESPKADQVPAAKTPDQPKTADQPKAVDQPKPATGLDGFTVTDTSIAPVGVTGAASQPVDATKPVVATVKEDKPPTFKGFEVIPAKIETKDDGSMLVDGRYTIKGDGTAEKPYIVPWDVLTSVEETFDPQAAKKKLPQRVTMLDGKVVKLSGYVAFPMMVKEAKECLSMLNQWDGCCIGVPPTPYDAVEVALKRTISGDERFTTSGSVIGTFRVKPYLQGDWLIGLYVMEVGDLKSKDFGGAAGN